MPFELTEQQKQSLASRLPAGYDVEHVRLLEVEGQVAPASLDADAKAAITAAGQDPETASGPDIITDGKPTLMRVVAWLCHEGVNRNGDAFVAEELKVAAAQISPRNPLVMDWNHAAIIGGPGKVIGIWTKADYAFDQRAKQGQGAWGILLEGLMFAWLYPEIADTMLAEQARNGAVNFSMACIPASVEFSQSHMVLHNPVFFTNSALDVAPADPDALGKVKEGANDPAVEQGLRQQLVGYSLVPLGGTTSAATTANWQFTPSTTTAPWVIPGQAPWISPGTMPSITLSPLSSGQLSDAEVEKLAIKLASLIAGNSKEEGMTEKDETQEPQAPATEEPQAPATAEKQQPAGDPAPAADAGPDPESPTPEAELAELRVQHTELETAHAALRDAHAALEQELEAVKAKLAEYETAAAEHAKAAKLAARLAELPETYLAKHNELPEERRSEVEARWASMADDAWSEKVEDLRLAAPKSGPSYQERSDREGRLPVAGVTGTDRTIADRVSQFTRK